jgi:hypothetical protein
MIERVIYRMAGDTRRSTPWNDSHHGRSGLGVLNAPCVFCDMHGADGSASSPEADSPYLGEIGLLTI